MAFIQWLISLVWGGGRTLSTIAEQLRLARLDVLNSKTEQEKIAAQERVDMLTATLADTQNARSSAAGLPRWMAVIGFMIGFPIGLHVFLVVIGTSLAPVIAGGAFDWMLHIPKLPAPFDASEQNVICFFFGSAALVGGANAIASAIAKRGTKA
jgi:hypothetical protein